MPLDDFGGVSLLILIHRKETNREPRHQVGVVEVDLTKLSPRCSNEDNNEAGHAGDVDDHDCCHEEVFEVGVVFLIVHAKESGEVERGEDGDQTDGLKPRQDRFLKGIHVKMNDQVEGDGPHGDVVPHVDIQNGNAHDGNEGLAREHNGLPPPAIRVVTASHEEE